MSDAERLARELLSDDETRAEAAAAALAQLGEAAFDAVSPLLKSPDDETRWWAVRAAAAIPGPRSASALIAALDDAAPQVRQAAALGLRLHPAAGAATSLIHLLGDSDSLAARLASDALAALGPAALPELRPAAASPDAATRIHAVRAMALLRAQAAIPDLFVALDDPSTVVRHWAERGLEDLGVGMVFFSST
jgi:HEAT repeat protein